MSTPSAPIPYLTILSRILTDPRYHPFLAIIKGARNGAVYGTKVRLPHAVVNTLLWGHGNWKIRLQQILSLTRQHAMGLAGFVTVYKILLLTQRWLNGNKPRPLDTFIAGLLGGYFVFGDRTAVNEQIALYVSSRVLLSLLPREYKTPYNESTHPLSTVRSNWVTKQPIPPDAAWFRMFSALAWAGAMYRFTHHSETFQPGMFSSMRYLYVESEWWDSLKTLLWHNK